MARKPPFILRVGLTYAMQALAVANTAGSLFTGYFAWHTGNWWMLIFQIFLLAVNCGFFVFQGHLRQNFREFNHVWRRMPD